MMGRDATGHRRGESRRRNPIIGSGEKRISGKDKREKSPKGRIRDLTDERPESRPDAPHESLLELPPVIVRARSSSLVFAFGSPLSRRTKGTLASLPPELVEEVLEQLFFVLVCRAKMSTH